MVKYFVFSIIVIVILYFSFRGEEPQAGSTTGESTIKNKPIESKQAKDTAELQKATEDILEPEAVEAAEPVIVGVVKPAKESIVDSRQADESLPKVKRKLVGGAEVEWIENPESTLPKTKFGHPPM